VLLCLVVYMIPFLLVPCFPLTPPENGEMTCSLGDDGVLSYSDICTFTCNAGYELFASETRKCYGYGRWSGTDAICVGMCSVNYYDTNVIKAAYLHQHVQCSTYLFLFTKKDKYSYKELSNITHIQKGTSSTINMCNSQCSIIYFLLSCGLLLTLCNSKLTSWEIIKVAKF